MPRKTDRITRLMATILRILIAAAAYRREDRRCGPARRASVQHENKILS